MKKYEEIQLLKHLKGVGKKTIYKKYWGLLEASESTDDLISVLTRNESRFQKSDIDEAYWKAQSDVQKLGESDSIKAITVFDDDYPEELAVMKDSRPLVMYVKGDISCFRQPKIAVVGTRHPSEWSKKIEPRLVRKILQLTDSVIVSGLAIGCDTIAHEETVREQRQTIAVLPSGVNVITPSTNTKLADAILQNDGCIISEYELDAIAFKPTFVERDAIVAALSDIVIAIECGTKSGTMHTIDDAFSYDRVIGCYYTKDLSKGDYSGNEFMMRERGSIGVSDTDDLEVLLKRQRYGNG